MAVSSSYRLLARTTRSRVNGSNDGVSGQRKEPPPRIFRGAEEREIALALVLALPGCMVTEQVTLSCSGTVRVLQGGSKDTIVFITESPANNYGVSSGTLNRITGAVSVHIKDGGLRILTGACKPTHRLF
jgi:hypothetical protein